MKTDTFFIRCYCLVAALLTGITAYGQQKTDEAAFSPLCRTTVVKALRANYSKSDTIDLRDLDAIYALSIDATVTQPREGCFVRIVLEDKEGHDYLVAESDRFRNDCELVRLSDYCEETAMLAGITPMRLKCYLSDGATVAISAIRTASEMPERGLSNVRAQTAELKKVQVQNIVARINDYNERHGKLWRAGVNAFVLRPIEERQEVGSLDAYSANMMYYADGIYEIGERSQMSTNSQSDFVESFDWRDRHGRNWITSVKDQLYNGPCYIFAAVGAVESIVNLYYNDNTINADLSEEFICAYGYAYDYSYYNTSVSGPFEFMVTDSIIDEQSCQYNNYTYSYTRPTGIESMKLTGKKTLHRNNLSLSTFCDSIKYHLIHHGPGSWGGSFEHNTNYPYHVMTLVGWGTTQIGDTYTNITSTSSDTITATMSGKTYWIMKNSFGNSLPQYINIIINDGAYNWDECCFAETPITSRLFANREIICEDLDGDGYFNWGISEDPPATLPSWAHREKDANDNNRGIGPMDEKGNILNIDHHFGEFSYVDSYVSLTADSINYKHIIIEDGGTLEINQMFHCFPEVCVYVESGGTLTINGGIMENMYLDISPGATINILNGGELRPLVDEDLFSLPLNATLNIQSGAIRKGIF